VPLSVDDDGPESNEAARARIVPDVDADRFAVGATEMIARVRR
jgi:hypothetical protein